MHIFTFFRHTNKRNHGERSENVEQKIDGVMFAFGGTAYALIEILWRGYTHWSMLLLGGLCFVLIEKLQKRFARQPVWKTAVLCALLITTLEFFTGCVVNLLLGWQIWDYSTMPLNLLGQVSFTFLGMWYLLSIPAIHVARVLTFRLHQRIEL